MKSWPGKIIFVGRSDLMKRSLIGGVIGLFLIGLVPELSAQALLIDSLKTILKQQSLPAAERAMTLSRLSSVLSYKDLSKGKAMNRDAIEIARQNNSSDALAFAWAQQIGMEVRDGKDSLASLALNRAMAAAPQASPVMHGYSLYMKGFMENLKGQLDKAMASWQQALRYLSEPKGVLYQAGIYYHMFAIFAERRDSLKANMYAQLALQRALESNDQTMIAACWQTSGTNYLDNFFKGNDRVQLDSAVFAYQQSLKVFRQHSPWMKDQGVVILSALNLANIYMVYYPKGYLDSAKANIDLALGISQRITDKAMEINCYQVVSRLYRKTEQYAKAEEALLKGRALLDSLDPPDNVTAKNIYQLLAEVNEEQGDNAEALKYYKQYIAFYEKVFDNQQFEAIQQLEAKYQTAKKEEQLRRLQERTAFQSKQTRLYVIIGLIAIITLLALFVAYRFRLKYSLQREKLKDEAAARLMAEQRLMQNQKEQMHKELLAGALQVEHKNELLQNLKEKLVEKVETKPAKRQLEKIINEEIRVDEDFKNVRSEFTELHPEFFELLQQKANGKLTDLDLKYCAYFFMKLPTKQIANMLNVEAKSVRMTRYRIKQKLGLSKQEDLDSFLQHLKPSDTGTESK